MKKSVQTWLGNRVMKINVKIIRPMILLLLALGSASAYAINTTSVEACPDYHTTVLEKVTIKSAASGQDVVTCFYKRWDNQPGILDKYYDQITPLNWVQPKSFDAKSFNAPHECTEGRDNCKFSVTTITTAPSERLCVGSLQCYGRLMEDFYDNGGGGQAEIKNDDIPFPPEKL